MSGENPTTANLTILGNTVREAIPHVEVFPAPAHGLLQGSSRVGDGADPRCVPPQVVGRSAGAPRQRSDVALGASGER